MTILKTAIACTLSGFLVASQLSPAAAGPMPTNIATMKSMVADGPIQVHWRGGWGGGWGVGAGLLAGALIGGAIATSTYPYYGAYGAPYYYGNSYPQYGYYYPRTAYYGYGPYYGYRPYYRSYGYYRPYRVHHYHRWHRRW
jgi:hypothetical protein